MSITKVSPDLLDLDAGITISVSDNSDNLTLTSTDDDANSGPNLRLYRNSSSPADDDVVGVIDFEGRNNNSQDVIYANIQGEIMQEADGSEDGQLQFGVMKAGTLRNAFMIDRTEVAINEDSVDIDFRVESDANTHALFVQGSSGNVGIGVTPSQNFNQSAAGTVEARFASTDDDCFLQISSDTDEGQDSVLQFLSGTSARGSIVYDHNTTAASQAMTFKTGDNSERMRINGSGQLLLGTTSNNSDSYRIIVDTDGGAKGVDIRNISYNADNGAFRSVPSGNTSYRFAVMLNSSNSTVGKIEVTSANTTYTTSSDYRLKENVTPLENGLDRLNQLKPVKFNWIESGQEEEGFIAHEVDEIFSDAVVGEKDAVKDDGTVSPQTMDYGRITPLLVKAIQELSAEVEELKSKLNES